MTAAALRSGRLAAVEQGTRQAAAALRSATATLREVAGDARNGCRRAPRPYILIVDDDPTALRYAVESLRTLGGKVVTHTSPAAALDWLSIIPPGTLDLILADVVMPEIDGRAFRASAAALTETRIVLFTGVDDEADGPDILRKPLTPEELRRHVGRLLVG